MGDVDSAELPRIDRKAPFFNPYADDPAKRLGPFCARVHQCVYFAAGASVWFRQPALAERTGSIDPTERVSGCSGGSRDGPCSASGVCRWTLVTFELLRRRLILRNSWGSVSAICRYIRNLSWIRYERLLGTAAVQSPSRTAMEFTMTYSPAPDQGAPITQQPPHTSLPYAQPPAPKKARNVVGIIALIVAAVGFLFACIPGALIVGWVLLPVGFVLGIVAVCLSGKVKWQGIAAIIVSVVGTVVGVIVFFAVVAASFSSAFGGTEVEISDGPAIVEGEEPAAEEPTAEVGSRENPAALGATIEGDEWTVVINSVTPDATNAVLEENSFNDKPDADHTYMQINYTVTYTGDDAEGGMPAFVQLAYVTAAGVTVDGLDKIVVGPDEMDTMTTLYEGATITGNRFLQVPAPADGVIAVTPGMIADTIFVAID